MAATGAGMTERLWRAPEASPGGVGHIFHKAGGEGRRNFKHAVDTGGHRTFHKLHAVFLVESSSVNFYVVGARGVDFVPRDCRAVACIGVDVTRYVDRS